MKIKNLILQISGLDVLMGRDIAQIYGVKTKRINKSVKNNPDKFPEDYMFELGEGEFADLRSKFLTANFSKTRVTPKAFTEKGLYMLATILRSKLAVEATFAIIEIYSKICEPSKSGKELSVIQDKTQQKTLMHRSIQPESCRMDGGKADTHHSPDGYAAPHPSTGSAILFSI